MTATTIPADLASHRKRMMAKTGLAGNAYGIAPDEDHKQSGGYHCGQKDLTDIGRYHPPATANVGSRTEDYSVRQLRDRGVGGNSACAEDLNLLWPNGGKAAAIRFNNLLVRQLQAGDPALSALREVNFTPDGTARKRWDALHPTDGPNGDGVINSTDNADDHTHIGFWRNTANTPERAATLARIEAIAEAAIHNAPLANEEDDMGATLTGTIPPYDPENDLPVNIGLGIIEGGAANPRPGWFSLVADTFGASYAVRVMVGVLGEGGKIGWQKLGDKEAFVVPPNTRWTRNLPKNAVVLSVMQYAVNEDGNAVSPDPDKDLLPYPGGVAYFVELGAVAR